MQQQYHPQHQQQRYDLRPRPNKRSDVIPITFPSVFRRTPGKPPTATSVLRHFGLSTYSSYELGMGHYSKVYKAFQDNREVAVKIIKLNEVSEEFIKRFIPREKECWSKLRHRNICELFACLGCEEFNYLYMVMEYCPNGDLLSYIQKKGPLSDTKGRRWMRALLDAVGYLHKNRIAHRDIKAENACLNFNCYKVLKGIPYDVYKNDVWSLGVLCFVSMTSSMPFREDSNTNSAIVEQQRRRTYRWPTYVSPECRQSIDTMMAFYQDDRPTTKESKKLPFFLRGSNQAKMECDDDSAEYA
uniref:Protein kinase domain-containing protein n=1 Tax=Panagrolaimus davidi TaxID=227884 RepID=A0A914QV06_9BILA